MARFLARHHYCGRKPAAELVGRLRGAACGRAQALETEARRQVVLALVAALEPIVTRIGELTSEIRAALAEHADGPTFRSLFRDPKSVVTAASLLSEMGDCRERYPTIRILGRAWCGVIWRLWHDHDSYDPNRHTALQRLLATTT